jgi:hypothetical protein
MIRFIFYTFVFYIVIKILRMFLDPFFDKKDPKTGQSSNNTIHSNNPSKPQKPIAGEYIDYEEIK